MPGSSMISSDTVFEELRAITASIIWKNKALADRYEALIDTQEADLYMAANNGLITFDNIYQFNRPILVKIGIPESKIVDCLRDKFQIPEGLRNMAVSLYISDIRNNYVERNDYYRELNGLPPYDEDPSEFLYCYEYLDIPQNIPIHEMTLSDRYTLESRGYIAKLIARYPTKKWLHYVASKNIDIYKARSAESFAILSIVGSDPENITEDFKDVYKQCRDYMVRVHYSNAYKSSTAYYENFIALAILFMTIQLMNYKYLEADISRDFYDLESLRVIYDSYGVPFYETIPLKYHKRIVKRINALIAHKGNTKVLFDLCSLFDYNSMEIFYYYITKNHKLGPDGEPLFIFNEDGSLKYDSIYDISFAKVPVGEDPYTYIIDQDSHQDYFEITDPDPYWFNDEELLQALYEDEYNYISSKYIGVQLQFDLLKIIYEECYFFRMIQDKKFETQELFVYYDMTKVSIFDLVLFVAAGIIKRNGFPDVIPMEPEKIGKVLGFNFKDNLNTIRNDIMNNPYVDSDVEQFIINMDINDLNDVHTVYSDIVDLRRLLEKRMIEATSKEVYQAYREIYEVTMYTELMPEVYSKMYDEGTGEYEVASSFEELLQFRNLLLYEKLQGADIDLKNDIDNALLILKSLSSRLEYLDSADGIDIEILLTHLYNMLNFFRSAKTELMDFEIIYLLNSRANNMLKILIEAELHATVWKDDYSCFIDDIYANGHIQLKEEEYVIIREVLIHTAKRLWVEDRISYRDTLYYLFATVWKFAEFTFDDVMISIAHFSGLEDRIQLLERFFDNIGSHEIEMIFQLKDKLNDTHGMIMLSTMIPIQDQYQIKEVIYTIYDCMKFRDELRDAEDYQTILDHLPMEDTTILTSSAIYQEDFDLFDLFDEYHIQIPLETKALISLRKEMIQKSTKKTSMTFTGKLIEDDFGPLPDES